MGLLSRAIDRATQKAVERVPVGAGGAMLGGMDGASGGISSSQQLSKMSSSSWLFTCVDLIASKMAAIQWNLYETQPGGDRVLVQDTGRLPTKAGMNAQTLRHLWEKVNPFYTQVDFVETSYQHFELTGKFFWLFLRDGTGNIVELWPLRPDRVKPIPSREHFIAGYIYQIGAERIPLEPNQVLYYRRPNPMNPYEGLGVYGSLTTDVESDRNAATWTNKFFTNGASPGGIIEFKTALSDSQWEKFVQRWREQHQGVNNAHRVAVLEAAEWKDRKITQREMQFDQLRKMNRDIILGGFRIPPAMLGIEENSNRASALVAETTFSRNVLLPRAVKLRAMLNEVLAPMYASNLEFDYKDPTPADRELDLDVAERGYKNRILTRNESRGLLGFDATEDGGAEYAEAEPVLGRSLNGGDPPRLKEAPLAIDGGVVEAAPYWKALPPTQRVSDPLLDPPLERAEEAMIAGWEQRLKSEVEGIVKYLEQFKSLEFNPPFLGNAEAKLEQSDLGGIDWDWLARHHAAVEKELAAAFDAALSGSISIPQPEITQIYATQYAKERAAQLLSLSGDVSVIRLTQRRVSDLVDQTIASGQSVDFLSRQLRKDFAFSRGRAAVIARTETASCLGSGRRQSALMDGRNEKRWVTQGVGDPRVDAVCLDNEQQGWIKITEVFRSRHDTIPAHPNCQCVVNYRTAAPAQLTARGSDGGEFRCAACSSLLGVGLTGGQIKCRCGTLNHVPAIREVVKTLTHDDNGKVTGVKEAYYGG